MSTIQLESLIEKLDASCTKALEAALSMAVSQQHASVHLAHWLYQLLMQAHDASLSALEQSGALISDLKVDLLASIESIEGGYVETPSISQQVINTACESWLLAGLEFHQIALTPSFVFLGLLKNTLLRQHALQLSKGFALVDVAVFESLIKQQEPSEPIQASMPSGNAMLEQYTVD